MSVRLNVIIPAAGEATRLRPITSNLSKSMVPINGKPVIDYILDYLAADYECAQIVIVHGQNRDIPKYISAKYAASLAENKITLACQPVPNGPVDAICFGAEAILDKTLPCVIWLGDTIITEDMPLGTDFIAACHEVEDQSEWCIFDGLKYHNKPTEYIDDGKALVGVYSFAHGKNFHHVCKRRYKDISDIIQSYGKTEMFYVLDWYDMGNFRTFYETSAKLLNQKSRAFNTIEVDTFYGTLTKTSERTEILFPEMMWYGALTPEQKLFTPTILDAYVSDQDGVDTGATIRMTLETGVLLSDLLVYDNLPITTWEYLLDKLFKIMHEVFYRDETQNEAKLNVMYTDKTVSRLCDSNFFSRSQYNQLLHLANQCIRYNKWSSMIHGDLHTGNIIFEPISGKMKLIDPRGAFGGKRPCTEGDRNYDMFKLAHDLFWGYNHMVAGVDHTRDDIKELFCEKLNDYGYNVKLILDGGLLLLATCIPLHNDNPVRQQKFEALVSDNL